MSIQLSISLLASDRRETLRKCLDSITPLLREIPSELVVVFTGEDPEVERISREYTDQVIPFTWCNDFSAARNAGLKKAKGEWFMFLDDDEWFEDVGEICAFFKSGEYRKYRSAEYIVRNYMNFAGTKYVDASQRRMTKRTKETRFVYAIHETYYPLEEPAKYLKAFVHHYGYVKKKKGNKAERNLPLLLQELEESPTDRKLCMQIAQEYGKDGDFEKAEEYCKAGLEVMREGGQRGIIDNWLLAFYPMFINDQEETQRALREAEDILRHDAPCELVEGWLHYTMAKAAEKLKEYAVCAESVRKFCKVADRLKRDPELCDGQSCGNLQYSLLEDNKETTCLRGLSAAHKLRDKSAVQELLGWILTERERTEKNDFYAVIDEWKRENKDEEEAILKYFRDLESADVYVTLQKALYAELKGHREDAEAAFRTCVSKENLYLRYPLAYLGVRGGFDLSGLMEQIDLQVWTGYAKEMAKDVDNEELEAFFEKAKKVLVVYPLHYAVLERFCLERKLHLGMLDGKELCEVAEEYAKSVVGYYRSLYKEELFREKMWFCLPVECRFAMLLVDALESVKRKDFKAYMDYTRQAAYVSPDMGHVLKKLTGYVQKQLEAPPAAANPEFALLGRQVKESVRQMIGKRQYREAMAVIGQLEALLPDDLEVLRMKQQILREE